MKDRALPVWEHFPHEADMGVRGYGATRNQAFEQAGLACKVARLSPVICIKG